MANDEQVISLEEVYRLAKLAFLEITEEEAKGYLHELNSILGYVQKLGSVNVQGVEPMSHVHGVENVFRPDQVEPHLPVEEGLRNAPDRSGRFIRVPIIIDSE